MSKILIEKTYSDKTEKEAVFMFRNYCLRNVPIDELKKSNMIVTKDSVDPLSTINRAWIIKLQVE